jgi:hypothetical protein
LLQFLETTEVEKRTPEKEMEQADDDWDANFGWGDLNME